MFVYNTCTKSVSEWEKGRCFPPVFWCSFEIEQWFNRTPCGRLKTAIFTFESVDVYSGLAGASLPVAVSEWTSLLPCVAGGPAAGPWHGWGCRGAATNAVPTSGPSVSPDAQGDVNWSWGPVSWLVWQMTTWRLPWSSHTWRAAVSSFPRTAGSQNVLISGSLHPHAVRTSVFKKYWTSASSKCWKVHRLRWGTRLYSHTHFLDALGCVGLSRRCNIFFFLCIRLLLFHDVFLIRLLFSLLHCSSISLPRQEVLVKLSR